MPALTKGKPLIIVYHADCIDGAASAWAVARAHGAGNPAAEDGVIYVPYEHFNKAAALDKIRAALAPEAELYFVDAAPEKAFLDELMAPAGNGSAKLRAVHVLDHHKSAAEMLKDYPLPAANSGAPALEIFIDAGKASAAKMVWQKLLPAEKAPEILDLIDKMDGSAAGLKTPEDFAAAAYADSHDIQTASRAFNTLRGLASLSFNEMAKKGAPVLADQDARIDKLLAGAAFAQIQILPDTAPVSVPMVNGNVQHFGRQISDRLVELGKKNGTGAAFAWFVQKTGAVTVSIRTNGDPDASQIAAHLRKTMGATGGGHGSAAAVHFSSLFEFARHFPLQPAPQQKPAGPKNTPGPEPK